MFQFTNIGRGGRRKGKRKKRKKKEGILTKKKGIF